MNHTIQSKTLTGIILLAVLGMLLLGSVPNELGNATWLVAGDNRWGPDFVGFDPDAVTFYRQNGRVPCGYISHQIMIFTCTFNVFPYQTNTVTANITATTVSSSRNGHGATRTWP